MNLVLSDLGFSPGWWVGMTVWTGVVLLAAYAVERAFGRRMRPGLRMALYGAVFVRLCLPVQWDAPWGVLASSPVSETEPSVVPVVASAPSLAAKAIETPGHVAPSPKISHPVVVPRLSSSRVSWGSLVYGGGLVLWLAAFGVALARTRRHVQQARPAPELGPGVRVHPTAGPFAAGIFAPTIIVPQSLLQEPEEDKASVLAHERAHLRTRDPAIGVLLSLACIVAWPVLPVWIAARRIRLLMEMRADAAVIGELPVRGVAGYRRVLLRQARARWMPSATLGFGPITDLQSRLRALEGERSWSWPMQVATGGIVVGLAFGCTGVDRPDHAQGPARTSPNEAAGTPSGGVVRDDASRSTSGPEGICAPAQREAEALTAWLVVAAADPSTAVETATAEIEAAHDDGLGVARARAKRGHAHAVAGDFAAAVGEFQEAAWLAASERDDAGAATAAAYTMLAEERQGNVEAARAWARHVEAALRRTKIGRPLAVEPVFRDAMIRLQADEAPAHRASVERTRAQCGDLATPSWVLGA